MYISYFDETGDDGYPKRETDLFVLTSGTIHHANWQKTFKDTTSFRRYLRDTHGFPIHLEMHTKDFLLNKNAYRPYGFDEQQRLKVLQDFADFLASTDLDFINVAINKARINSRNQSMYKPVLDAAVKFSVQRIENTINASQPGTKFLMITDEGRVGTMRKTTRRIQKINYIPSKMTPGSSYRQEIALLLEDPLPKNSKQSHFVQFCDFVSFIAYYRLLKKLGLGNWHGRLSWLTEDDIEDLLNRLSPVLNLKANSGSYEYGFVIYPK